MTLCRLLGHRFHLVTSSIGVLEEYALIVKLDRLAFICDRCLKVKRYTDFKRWRPGE